VIRVESLSSFNPAPYEWLWRHRIPQGAVTILNGKPDAGKSTIYTDIAARVTTGRAMPGESDACGPGNVMLLATEDNYASVVRPRMDAAGADADRVKVVLPGVGGDGLEIPPVLNTDGLQAIQRAMTDFAPRLFVIDPFTNYLPPDVNSHVDQDVRRVLAPLSLMAASHRCAVVVVRHHALDKSRGAGSVGIGGIARAELTAAKVGSVTSNIGKLTVAKRNHAPNAGTLLYRFVSVGHVARLEWDDDTTQLSDKQTLPAVGPSEIDKARDRIVVGARKNPGLKAGDLADKVGGNRATNLNAIRIELEPGGRLKCEGADKRGRGGKIFVAHRADTERLT